eukprot:CAMPEP_0172467146 /NCGR_PEP_ID=MMETSP1065-20121228/58062_1 /TAXON_ID=265537 /ORGANISM="Amphiprora paludosa, Strain CCMP125" /LENGTH=354 /DNA_ID=CAMNT_0013224201 /DNA_START=17 /DNA_END=1081 /DNA_ORIENTATION=-
MVSKSSNSGSSEEANPSEMKEIPVISLDQKDAAQALVRAFETIGFATLIDHGVDPSSMQAAFHASSQFFSLPTSTKMESKYQSHSSNRGYIPFQAESHDHHQNPDHKETFDIGWDGGDDDESKEKIAEVNENGSSEFTTPWPKEEVAPNMKEHLVAYFQACNTLNLRVMRLLGEGMELDDVDFFVKRCNEKHCNLRLLHYPELIEPQYLKEPVLVRGQKHTDFGTVSLLAQDSVGGLRVQKRGETQWFPVPPVANSFVVNVGDMLQRWTNDRLLATPHQVVHYNTNPGTNDASSKQNPVVPPIPERYSIAFFCNANKDVLLDGADFAKSGETVPYEPVKSIDYITQRLADTIST